MNSNGSDWWDASAIVAALIFPLTIGYERFKAWRHEKAEVRAVLLGIKTEIESGLKIYKPIADVVSNLKDGEPFPSYWRATYDYFSIYHGNTAVIGKIKKHALRESIVGAYTHMKGHIENFSFNNDMLKDYEQFLLSSEFLDPKNPAVVEHIKRVFASLVQSYEILILKSKRRLHGS